MNRQELRQHSMPELALDQAVVSTVEKALKSQLIAYVQAIPRRDGTKGGPSAPWPTGRIRPLWA